LAVHTDDAHGWTNGVCDQFDSWVPQDCNDFNTRTDVDVNTPALIWFIAWFPATSSPGVTVVYFGHDHSMPQYYHNRWGLCGPAGSLELPDGGWPDAPAAAGNSVAFGTPVVGDYRFPFYYFDVWGETGWHYCTAINPVGGYAAFVDDSNPPELDEIYGFGCVYYGTDTGYNDCGVDPLPGACCFEDGSCLLAMDLNECLALGGYEWLGNAVPCDPNPCPQPGACCFPDGSCQHVLEETCYQIGGSHFIPGESCDPNPCGPLYGPCCFADGSCEMLPPQDCEDEGGTWYGDEYQNCDPNPCPPPVGCCCWEDGSSQVLTEEECIAHGGYLWVPDSDCDPNPCPAPGACCYGCQECVFTVEPLCMELPDWYQWIPDTFCEPNPCPPVAAETTTWGSIKADYK
jgi:hypothetical protein